MAVLVPVTGLLETAKIFHSLEPAFLNSDVGPHNILNAQRICRVIITRDDYMSPKFNGKLDPAGLGKVIDAIEAQHPAAILVDFDVSDASFAALRTHTAQMPVVWTRNSVHSAFCHQDWPERAFGESGPVTSDQGLGALAIDEDGVVRRYSRLVASNGPPQPGVPCPSRDVPSIAWAALLRAERSAEAERSPRFLPDNPQATSQPLLIHFQPKMGPGDLPDSYTTDVASLPEAGKIAPEDAPMKGKIVLFGGRYDPGDEHLTPAGLSFGVDIIAAIIGTELDGGGRPPVNSVALFALAFASAVVLWLLMSRLASKPLTVLVVLGGAIVWVFASLCSFLLTGSYRLRGSFIVILLFVLGNRIWNDFQHKREEKAALPGPAAPQA